MISNLRTGHFTSPVIVQLSEQALKLRDPDDVCADLGHITPRVADFCAAIKHGPLTDPAGIISTALALDAELVSWATNIPSSWAYTTVTVPASSELWGEMKGIYGNYYHVYKSLGIGGLWNGYRNARLILHEIILKFVERSEASPEDDGYIVQHAQNLANRSKAILLELSEEICASVPYHFGAPDHSNGTNSTSYRPDRGAAGGYILMWPLFIAGGCPYTPPAMQRWILTCLDKIGHVMGINEALTMADRFRRGVIPRPWMDSISITMDRFG
jgi:hypothetical protein